MLDLIPRELLFGNPDVAQVHISPDGKWISYIAPSEGVLNVWLAPSDNLAAAKVMTHDRKRGIRSHGWTFDSRYLGYVQDEAGDENWHIHAVSLANGEDRDLTPFPKTQAHFLSASPERPTQMLVALNNRDEKYHDVHLLDLESGQLTEVFRNEQQFMGVYTDDDLQLRMLSKYDAQGDVLFFERTASGEVREFQRVKAEDALNTGPMAFLRGKQNFYWRDSAGRDTSALYRLDPQKGTRELVWEDDRCDVSQVMCHPLTGEPEAVCLDHGRKEWKVISPAVKGDLEFLQKNLQGDLHVVSRTLDDQRWIVLEINDDGPNRFFRYDRKAKELQFLMSHRQKLEGVPLSKMRPVVLTARDGLKMVCYLSLPPEEKGERPAKPVPMVLNVHGGPWHRDVWGFDRNHQLLANRGYAVLSVNFRGSTGFGKKFINAANFQWGAKMHDDLVDAVQWAIAEKIADPAKIAVYGGSYGGYAALAGLTFTPDLFACGVDIVGPSNLNTLLASVPPYWTAGLQLFYDRMGDPRTPEGRQLLEDRSPLNHVEKIKKPLLIAQGANDPRVKQSESDQIVKAMQDKGIPVTYALFPDEGHGFARPENSVAFMAVTEAFLKKHLGGQAEPVGTAFEGSTIQIPEGREAVPGL